LSNVSNSYLSVIDIIFFPDFDHAPILRVDASGIPRSKCLKIEQSPYVLARVPELAGLDNLDNIFDAQDSKLFNTDSDRSDAKYFLTLIKPIITEHAIRLDEWRLWEVDVDGDNVSIRFIARYRGVTQKDIKLTPSFTVEFVNQILEQDGNNMLTIFDRSKIEGKLFLECLRYQSSRKLSLVN